MPAKVVMPTPLRGDQVFPEGAPKAFPVASKEMLYIGRRMEWDGWRHYPETMWWTKKTNKPAGDVMLVDDRIVFNFPDRY